MTLGKASALECSLGGRRKLDQLSGFAGKDRSYYISASLKLKDDDCREIHKVATTPCFELLRDELAESPVLTIRLQKELAGDGLGQHYREHPVVVANPNQLNQTGCCVSAWD